MNDTVDWRQKVSANLAHTRARRTGRRKYPYLFHLPCSLEWIKAMDQCAQGMGYNRSAWARRALSVAMARELGVDVKDLLKMCPSPYGVGRNGAKYVGDYDHGDAIEVFEP